MCRAIFAVAMLTAAVALLVASCEEETESATSSTRQVSTSTTGAGANGPSNSSSSTGGAGGPIIVADCQDGWCRIPAGEFVMGSPEDECGHPPSEETQVEVTLTHAFLIGQYEVTQAQWESYGLVNPSVEFPSDPDDKGNCIAPDCPVANINWFEAAAFSNTVSTAEGLPECYVLEGCTGNLGEGMVCTGMTLRAATVYDCEGYRLPTEAEWEYAARAGTTTAVYSGPISGCELSQCYPDPNVESIAWYCITSAKTSHPVGQLIANRWGLYDVIGNINEWTHSIFTPSGYGGGPLTDPGGESGPVTPTTARTVRGCAYLGWNHICRAAERNGFSMTPGTYHWGMRLARTLPD